MHSSARATARPPSLTSWQDRTRPARIAAWRRRYRAGALRVGLRGRADGVVVGLTGDEVEMAAGELGPRVADEDDDVAGAPRAPG